MELESKHIKPLHCGECGNQGVSDITTFPSLCKRNYLWFQCNGEFGYEIEVKEKDKCKGCGSLYIDPEFRFMKGGSIYCCEECYEDHQKGDKKIDIRLIR